MLSDYHLHLRSDGHDALAEQYYTDANVDRYRAVAGLGPVGAVAAKPNTPEEFAAWMRKDHDKWSRVVRETGIKLGN